MNGLYPIMRRVRRPLLPVEAEAPKAASVTQSSEPPKRSNGDEPKKTLTVSIDENANAYNEFAPN